MKSYSDILAELQARKDRSAWDKGVTAYAVGLLDNYQDRAEYEGREAASCKELEGWLLNGAMRWACRTGRKTPPLHGPRTGGPQKRSILIPRWPGEGSPAREAQRYDIIGNHYTDNIFCL